MNRQSSVNLNSMKATRRRLIVERLEQRQLLSAMDVFITAGQIDESVFVESADCRVPFVSNGLSPLSGFYASHGGLQGRAIARPELPSEVTKNSPLDSALSSNNRVTDTEESLTPPTQERDWGDEDVAEGENPFDPSAPPIEVDPPIDRGGDIVSVPTLPQAIMPFGYYFDSVEGQFSLANRHTDESSDQLELYGGYVELQLLRRYEFDVADEYRDTWNFETMGSSAVPPEGADDESLMDLGLMVAEDYVSAEDIENQVDMVDWEFDSVDSQADSSVLSVVDHAAFCGDFGGMIIYAFDQEALTVPSEDGSVVASNHRQERPREQYQIVDAIVENTQAFDVMADEAAGQQTDSVETATEVLETTLQQDAAPIDGEATNSVSSSSIDVSVTSSASVALLVISNRRKKKKPSHEDCDNFMLPCN